MLFTWVQSRIEEIERTTNATDRKKKQQDLAAYWGYGFWSHFLAGPYCKGRLRNLLPDEKIRSAPNAQKPLPEPHREAFLKDLHKAINRFYDEEDVGFKPVSLPEDYCVFLSIANGIIDKDLRGAKIAGVDEIVCLPLHDVVPEPERLPCHRDFKRGWDIDVGIILGRGHPEHENWLVYSYCARKELTQYGDKRSGGEIQPHERI